MVNVGILLLIITIIILTIIIISVLIFTAVSNKPNNNPGVIQLPCSKSVDISSLIQIPSDYPSCIQEGEKTSKYYVGKLNPDFDFVVAPFQSSAKNVCIGYCTTFLNGVCSGSETSQQNYDNCIKQLTPTTDCIPPIPIAAIGATLYYPFSPTCNTCENCDSLPPKI